MQAELSKWRRAMTDKYRELLVSRGDAEGEKKVIDKRIADIDHELCKIDEALDKDGRDRSTIDG